MILIKNKENLPSSWACIAFSSLCMIHKCSISTWYWHCTILWTVVTDRAVVARWCGRILTTWTVEARSTRARGFIEALGGAVLTRSTGSALSLVDQTSVGIKCSLK